MSKTRKISPRMICQAAIFIALEIVLNRFCSINTMGLKIGISFIPIAVCAMLYGPVWAAGVAAMADFLGAMLFPIGPYFIGFSVSAAAIGAVYGLFLHNESGKIRFFPNVISATLINCIVIGLFVNTGWISLLYSSKDYWGWFVYRIVQYAVLVPVNLIVLPLLEKLTEKMRSAGIVDSLTVGKRRGHGLQ